MLVYEPYQSKTMLESGIKVYSNDSFLISYNDKYYTDIILMSQAEA